MFDHRSGSTRVRFTNCCIRLAAALHCSGHTHVRVTTCCGADNRVGPANNFKGLMRANMWQPETMKEDRRQIKSSLLLYLLSRLLSSSIVSGCHIFARIKPLKLFAGPTRLLAPQQQQKVIVMVSKRFFKLNLEVKFGRRLVVFWSSSQVDPKPVTSTHKLTGIIVIKEIENKNRTSTIGFTLLYFKLFPKQRWRTSIN